MSKVTVNKDQSEYEEFLREQGMQDQAQPVSPVTPPVNPASDQSQYEAFMATQDDANTWLKPSPQMGGGRIVMTGDVLDVPGQIGAGLLDTPGFLAQGGADIAQLGSILNTAMGGREPSRPLPMGGNPLEWWQKNVSGTADSVSRFTGRPLNSGMPYYIGGNVGSGAATRGVLSASGKFLGGGVPKAIAEKSAGDTVRNVAGDVAGTVGGAAGANLASGVTDNPYVVGGAGLLGGLSGGATIPLGGRVAGEALHQNKFTNKGRENIVGREFFEALGGQPLGQRVETVPGMRPTAAQAFDNQGLMALQQGDMSRSPGGIGLLSQRMSENDDAIRAELERLGGTGDIADTINYAANKTARQAGDLANAQGAFAGAPLKAETSAKVRADLENRMELSRTNVNNMYQAVGGKDIPVDGNFIANKVEEFTNKLDPTEQSYVKNFVTDNLRGAKTMDGVISVLKKLNSQFKGSGADSFIRGELSSIISDNLDEVLTKGQDVLPGLKMAPVEGGADALQRWRDAKQAFIEHKKTWMGQPDLGATMRQNRIGVPAVTPEATLGKLFGSGPEGAGKVKQLLSVSDTPETINAIGDFAFQDMRQARTAAYARDWMQRHRDILNVPQLRGVRDKLQRIADQMAKNEEMGKDPFYKIAGMNSSMESNVVQTALGGLESTEAPARAAKIKGLLQAEGTREATAALNGLQKGLLNTILMKSLSGAGDGEQLSAAKIAKQFNTHRGLLSQFLTPDQIRQMEVAANSARVNRLNKAASTAGASDTSHLTRRIGGVMDDIATHPAAATAAGGAAGLAVGGVPGMFAGAIGGGLLHGPVKAANVKLDNARIRAHLSPDAAERIIKNAAKRQKWLDDHPVSGLLKSPTYWLSTLNTSLAGAKDASDRRKDRK